MCEFQKWDVWQARVAFEDNPAEAKERPVLIVSPKEFYILSMKITSHEPREEFEGEYEIRRWQDAGLTQPSTIRTSKRLRLLESDMLYKRGVLHPTDIRNLQLLFIEMARNK